MPGRRASPRARARGVGLLLCALVALAGCAPSGETPDASPTDGPSGIAGIVLVGPDCPDPSEASPCLSPYEARLVILDIDGRFVGEVTSGPDGRFSIELPPGDYVIQPAPGGDPFPRAEARTVTVVEGELSEVEIDYERGRR